MTTLEAIDLGSVKSTGYVFQTDLAYRTVRAGLRLTEVPIEFIERERGDSKMSGSVASESLRMITRWGLPERRRPASTGQGAGMTAPTPTQVRDAAAGGCARPRRRVRRRAAGRDLGPSQVGQLVGPWWTIVLLVLDSMLGAWLIKREGGRAWTALREALQSGRMPAREIADGALILIGGTLMLSPGFVLDIAGIVLILPFTRPVARRLLDPGGRRGGWLGPRTRTPGPDRRPRRSRDDERPGPGPGGPVVRGDVVDDDATQRSGGL